MKYEIMISQVNKEFYEANFRNSEELQEFKQIIKTKFPTLKFGFQRLK